EALNMADALLYETEKVLPEFEGKVSAEKIEAIKQKREALKGLLAEKDRDAAKVKAALDELQKAVSAASVEMYQKVQSKGGPQAEADGSQQKSKKPRSGNDNDNVVDADFKVEGDK
ncbi:MAG: molecular chaperone DnaK, partial [Candidatus Diapherotrites archaeon]|nr:molecular chaperone DnaK [Candidatus Diapherotrites archaeon]